MHRLLERQLRRNLGKDFQPDQALGAFLDIVDSYYHEVDKEQRLLQNALSMNTAELNEVNERMRLQNTEMTRTLLNTLSDGVYATDHEGQLTFMNAAAEGTLGWLEHELIGQPLHAHVPCLHNEGAALPLEDYPQFRVMRDGVSIQGHAVFGDRKGTCIPVEFRASPIILNGQINGTLVSFQDISLQIEAENKLQLANQQLKSTLRELEFRQMAMDEHAIVSITDRDDTIIYANNKLSEISQYTREELIGQNQTLFNSDFHPDTFSDTMWQTTRSGKVWHGEVRNKRRDGSYFWVQSTVAPLMDAQGRPERFIAVRTDITSRKALEAELLEQRAFYERISETIGEGLYVLDATGHCTYLNSEAEKMLGWTREELLGMQVHDTIHNVTAEGDIVTVCTLPYSAGHPRQGRLARRRPGIRAQRWHEIPGRSHLARHHAGRYVSRLCRRVLEHHRAQTQRIADPLGTGTSQPCPARLRTGIVGLGHRQRPRLSERALVGDNRCATAA